MVDHFSVIIESDSQMMASPFGNGKECRKSKSNTLITDHHVSRPKRTWREVVQKDCQACNLNREDAMDRSRWKKLIKIG